MHEGVLAGYPVVDIKVSVVDGSYHEVDSSDMAFKIAASNGIQKGLYGLPPGSAEPVMNVEVTVPDDMTGDIIGDLNSRRGRVLGMDQGVGGCGGKGISGAAGRNAALRHGSYFNHQRAGGMFTMEFDHYDEVLEHLSEKNNRSSKNRKEEK